MSSLHQIDLFNKNIFFLHILGLWPLSDNNNALAISGYKIYSKTFLFTFIFMYITVQTISYFYVPKTLEFCVEELILYLTEFSVFCKAFTLLVTHKKIICLFETLESDIFQPKNATDLNTINKTKKIYKAFYVFYLTFSVISYTTHVCSPFIAHLFFGLDLRFPISTYSFLNDTLKEMFKYPIFFYQCLGMNYLMLCNVNFDSLLLGLMFLAIAQLEILYNNLSKINKEGEETLKLNDPVRESECIAELNQCIKHYEQISKFCADLEDIFSVVIFVQFGLGSSIICVSLFRFLLPSTTYYYVFLVTYCIVMILQILAPCWFGTELLVKSEQLTLAAYSNGWPTCSEPFKRNLRVFVERASRPITITGGKMFRMTLQTFTSIMKTSYSFFALLRHLQVQKEDN